MPFVFTDTNTERVDLSRFFASNPKFDPAYQPVLNEARQRVCDTLASQPSSQPLLDAIDEYLPHVLALIDVSEKSKLVETEYTWKSVMTIGVISGLGKNKSTDKKSYKIASIYFEGIYLMIAYALGMANMAGKKIGSQPSLTAESVLNEAIDLYCKASGILSVVGLTWATRWNGQTAKSRPPETTPAGLQMLSEFMLLEAQILAALKAEKRGMSVPTLVKLQRSAVEKFETVKGHLRGVKSDWSDSFLSYLNEGSKLYEALMLKRYAAHCHAEDKNGMAVGCMTKCYNTFVVDMPKVTSPAWTKIYADHKDDLKPLLDTYVRINNHVTYEKIPSDEDMMAGLPTATSLVERKAFNMPEPAEIPERKIEEIPPPATNNSYPGQPPAAGYQNQPHPSQPGHPDAPPYRQGPPPPAPAQPQTPPQQDGPKASVRDAFKSLLKTDKKDLK